jgi:hypothetical protein
VATLALQHGRARLATQLRSSNSGLMLLALIVGLGAGGGAIVFRWLIKTFTLLLSGHADYSLAGHAAHPGLPGLGRWFVIGAPALVLIICTTGRRHGSRRTAQPENMTEQAECLLKLEGESRGVDICGPKWPEHGPETQIGRGLDSSKMVLPQYFSPLKQVTGIEPALSAWVLTVSRGIRQDG